MPLNKVPRHTACLAMMLFVIAVLTATRVAACGMTTDCMIGDRTYRIALPEGNEGAAPIPAILFVHGYRGKAANVMHNKALLALTADPGVALIAAQASGPEWNIPGVPSADAAPGVDELQYFDALIDDAVRRFDIDRTRVMVAGFSSGAMMVWNLACKRGQAYLGFVPMSGTFWEPLPERCPSGPVNLIHYHGTKDTIVPLQGRPLKDSHQGDVTRAISLMVGHGTYTPRRSTQTGDLKCDRQQNSTGRLLELCLFPGKHQMRVANIRRAWKIFATQSGE